MRRRQARPLLPTLTLALTLAFTSAVATNAVADDPSPPPGAMGRAQLGACTDAFDLSIAADRNSIPYMGTPSGGCGAPGTPLPIHLAAQVQTALGAPVPDCPVLFFVDFASLDSCALAFGEFCPSGMVALTNALGVAEVTYTMTQADLDFCNCLPSSDCTATFCPTPTSCAPECAPGLDRFCQISINAGTRDLESLNQIFIEYGR